MAPQDVFTTGSGTTDNRAVTRCKSALTGQELGRWRRIRSLYCLTCVAPLKRVRISVEGGAVASGVCASVWVRRAWWRTEAAHDGKRRMALARKVVAEG